MADGREIKKACLNILLQLRFVAQKWHTSPLDVSLCESAAPAGRLHQPVCGKNSTLLRLNVASAKQSFTYECATQTLGLRIVACYKTAEWVTSWREESERVSCDSY